MVDFVAHNHKNNIGIILEQYFLIFSKRKLFEL